MSGFLFPGAVNTGAANVGNPAVPMSFEIPSDPTWEPIERADVLEKDGYYAFRVIAEKQTDKPSPGVWITFEILDDDARGKRLQQHFAAPSDKPNLIFKWRGLNRSIWGIEAARAAFAWKPGFYLGQFGAFKTAAYENKDGDMATGVDSYVTKEEYAAAAKDGKHRWPAAAKVSPAGAFSKGVPGGFGLGTQGAQPGLTTQQPPQPAETPPMQTTAPAPETTPAPVAPAPQTGPVNPFAALMKK